jgi:hypothetical protein
LHLRALEEPSEDQHEDRRELDELPATKQHGSEIKSKEQTATTNSDLVMKTPQEGDRPSVETAK